MFYLSNLCLLCLNSKQLENVLIQNDNGIAIEELLKHCLPEITISKAGIPEFICSPCRTTVHSFYKFRKTCLENYSRLIQYTRILQGSSDTQGQKFTELQVHINNLDWIKQEQDVDSALNIQIKGSLLSLREHDYATDNVDVKNEFALEFTELQKQLYNQVLVEKQEQEVDSTVNIKVENEDSLQILECDQRTDAFDTVVIKNEFVVSEDSEDHAYEKYIEIEENVHQEYQFNELHKQINNKQEVNSKLNINIGNEVSLQHLNEDDYILVDDNALDISEEIVKFEDTEDHEFYLKYMKNESVFDNEQESVSRSNLDDENQSNVDESNFSADADNVHTDNAGADVNLYEAKEDSLNILNKSNALQKTRKKAHVAKSHHKTLKQNVRRNVSLSFNTDEEDESDPNAIDGVEECVQSLDNVNSHEYISEKTSITSAQIHNNLRQNVKRNISLSFNTDEFDDPEPYATDSEEEYIPSDTDDSDEYISETETSLTRGQVLMLNSSPQNIQPNSLNVLTDPGINTKREIPSSVSSDKYVSENQASITSAQSFVPNSDDMAGSRIHTRERSISSMDIVKNKYVPTSTAVGTYTKIFFCVFCKKRVKRFGKHIITHHKTEEAVTKIIKFPARSTERQRLITNLRNAGTFMYNNVDELNMGDLIVSRRPNPKKQRNPNYYTPCKYCKAYFVSNNMHRHYKTCTLNPSRQNKNAKSESRALQMQLNYKKLNLHPNVPFLLQNLRDDEVAKVIKEDFLLLKLASYLSNKFCTKDHLNYHCRQKLRQLSRLLITIKSENPDICDLRDCIQPKNFKIVIKGVQKLCGLNCETGEYKNPSLAQHLGIYLKECTNVLYNICIIEEKHSRKTLVDDFKHLLSFEYTAAISKSASKTVEQSKWNKPKLLPRISDIKIFRDHLVAKAEFSFKKLCEEKFSYMEWRNLMEITAALVLIFNRKTPGESEGILLQNYKSKQKIEKDSEDYKTLSTLEKVLCDTFTRIEIQGKFSRRVPILLRKTHIRYIDAFLQFRSEAGVSETNKYLFGLDKDKFIRPTDILRREAELCDAKQPHLLRVPFLRKQVATTSQLLELNDNEIQMLAEFISHDLQIPKDYYRTPDMTLQIANLSNLLIAVDNCDVEKYKRKNLQTMDISLNTEVDCDPPEEVPIDPLFNDADMNTLQTENIYAKNLSKNNPVYNAADMDAIEIDNIYSNNLCTNNPVNNHTDMDTVETENVNSNNLSTNNDKEDSLNIQTRRKNAHVPKYIATPQKIIKRTTWKTPEKKAVRELFPKYLENFTLPREKDVAEAKKNRPELANRTAIQIKAWINNENNRRLREHLK